MPLQASAAAGLTLESKSSQSSWLPWQELKLVKPSLSASMVSPSSMLPSQSSSMPLQTSAAAGLTLGSKSSQSGMVPLGHEGRRTGRTRQPSLSVQPPAADTAVIRRSRCSHRRCHCRLPRCGIDTGVEVIAVRDGPTRARGVAELADPSPSLSVQPPPQTPRRPPFRCSHRRCHCRLPRLRD